MTFIKMTAEITGKKNDDDQLTSSTQYNERCPQCSAELRVDASEPASYWCKKCNQRFSREFLNGFKFAINKMRRLFNKWT